MRAPELYHADPARKDSIASTDSQSVGLTTLHGSLDATNQRVSEDVRKEIEKAARTGSGSTVRRAAAQLEEGRANTQKAVAAAKTMLVLVAGRLAGSCYLSDSRTVRRPVTVLVR
jgi:hypothetical protein